MPWRMVEPVLAQLPGPLAACVRLQWCTACGRRKRSRSAWRTSIAAATCGSTRSTTPRTSGGLQRIVALGPEAQPVLTPLVRMDGGFLVSPRGPVAEQKAEKRAARATPMTLRQRDSEDRNAAKKLLPGCCRQKKSKRSNVAEAQNTRRVVGGSDHRQRGHRRDHGGASWSHTAHGNGGDVGGEDRATTTAWSSSSREGDRRNGVPAWRAPSTR